MFKAVGGVLQWVVGIVVFAIIVIGVGLAISYFNTPNDAKWDSFVVAGSGRISFETRPDAFSVPEVTGASVYANVNYYTESGQPPIGAILPPARAGWTWNLDPGDVEARTFSHRQGVLNVDATLDHSHTSEKGFTVCL